ncbi:MAG: NADH dehydrogenase [Clostridiaceae bacterium]|nr:NADH dehydrogenase [Clostridiaceae bacterium]
MLFVILPVIPLIGVLLLLLKRNRAINLPFVAGITVLVLGSLGLKSVFAGNGLTFRLPLPGPFQPTFQADPLSAILVILTAFLFFVVSVYTPKYMKHEGGIKGFEACMLLTFSAVLGVFTAGDLVTMLLFFELMTITSCFWVIHRWNEEAIRAVFFYLFFSIIGGLFLGLGIVMMGAATDVLPAVGGGVVIPSDSKKFVLSMVLLVAGFGIKAGMVPLHLWLPHAHSAAPAPGSALLSGLLIKVGAYGLIRVGEFAGWGIRMESELNRMGPVLSVLGVCTMVAGVTAALLQSDAKRLLAYHSVSQMGYIILSLGIAVFMGADGGLALTGAVYHIVNHALFKAALFLGVGVIYIHTNETNLYKLGGLWRHFPVTAALMLPAVLGIAGAPGFNGYASKTMMHHAVSAAAKTGTGWMLWVERLFTMVGVGTAASFTKLYYLMFLGKPAGIKVAKNRAHSLQIAMGLLAVVMIAIGVVPQLFPDIAAIPAVQALGMENASNTLAGISFWNFSDIFSMLITLILGMLVCWIGLKSGVFHRQPPSWLTLEGLGKLAGQGILALSNKAAELYGSVVKCIRNSGSMMIRRIYSVLGKFGQNRNSTTGGVTLSWISADTALIIIALAFLIVWYTLINPGLSEQRLIYMWIDN